MELHYLASRCCPLGFFNVGVFREIAGKSDCDFGTAVLIYWAAISGYNEPEGSLQFDGHEQSVLPALEHFQRDLAQFISQLEMRLAASQFRNSCIRFNPREDYESSLQFGDERFREITPGEEFDEFVED
ncbi:hypothetical protein GC163_15435 [bacterium]|nr:hypothetical protein [bacterium]